MNNSLICYIDILGFSNTIRGLNEKEIKTKLDVLERVSGFFEQVKPLQQKHQTIEGDLNAQFMDSLSIDIFNDSILIIGDIPNGSLAEERWGREAAQFHFYEVFLYGCAYVYFMIFSDLKLMSRGAIVHGGYQRVRSKSFNAVLSPDIVDAVNLEKKEAVYPRIILGDSVLRNIDSITQFGPELRSGHLLKDKDGKQFLDVWKLVYGKVSNPAVIDLFNEAWSLISKQSFEAKDKPKLDWLKCYFGTKGIKI